MSNKIENQHKLEQLAKDVLVLSRNSLFVNLRFLDVALSELELLPVEVSTVLTDGKCILYNPKHILKSYKQQKENVVRDYLHMVLHCVYRHMYMGLSLEPEYWDLACDIAVENVINDLNLRITTTEREQRQKTHLEQIKKEMNIITAEKVDAYLRE